MPSKKVVYVQNWEESERGWGTRPDGFTVHTSQKQHEGYVVWYNKTFNNLSEAPDEYTRTCGRPIAVEVSDELYDRIHKATQEEHEDHLMNCVHGKEKFFSTSPMRELKEEDLRLGKS